MLSILKQVFSAKKKEDDDIHDGYHQLLIRLASGEEVDLEDVREQTVDAGKTEEECSRDLATMQQRLAKIEERKKLLVIQDGVPQLQAKFNSLKAEIDAVVARIQPQLDAIGLQLNETSTVGSQLHWIEIFLNNNVLNRSLLEREQEVGRQRQELARKRRPLWDDLQTAKGRLSYYNTCLRSFESRGDSWAPKAGSNQSKEMQKLLSSRDSFQREVDQLERAVWSIDQELIPFDQELADIAKQKLLP
jgi:septal ring factor EnvC (AmiA/AmiB activator)